MSGVGHLKKRGKKWHGKYQDEHGRQRWKALSADKRVASRLLAEIERRVDRARLGLDAEMRQQRPLPELIEEYADHLAEIGKTDKHVREVRSGLTRMLDGFRVASDVSPVSLTARRKALADGRAPRTLNKLTGFVTGMFAWAAREGRIYSDTLSGRISKVADPADGKSVRRHKLTDDQRETLRKTADAMGAVGDLYAVAIVTGFRIMEMARLRWLDFDRAARTLHVGKSKNGEERTIPIPRTLAERLRLLRERQFGVLGRLPTDEDLILLRPPNVPGPKGGRPMKTAAPWTHGSSTKALDAVLEAADIAKEQPGGTTIGWHSMRHTVATVLGAAGFSELQLQRWFGWKTAAMARHYVDVSRIPTDAMARTLDAWGGEREQEAQA